jgi:proteic killer suppression protein
MIKSFACRETRKVFSRTFSRKLPQGIQRRAKMRLDRIDAAVVLENLRHPPSHYLELLKGDRQGQHSIRINDQWRICFVWKGGNAYDVEIVDYH